MQRQQIYETLEGIFRDIFDLESISLTPNTSARDIPEWDSFNHINILLAVEQTFGVSFNTSEVEAIKNVGAFVERIETKLSHR